MSTRSMRAMFTASGAAPGSRFRSGKMQKNKKRKSPEMENSFYRDKIRGCWLGKCLGGAVGMPFEGVPFTVALSENEISLQDVPNDDLELQLVWMNALKQYGVSLTSGNLAEYWLKHIRHGCDEYSIALHNMAHGILPPASGWKNNFFADGMGAAIRSEIWACLFPGEPDEAAPFAWYDACVDHADDGIYAEIFTVSLESAAFIESDLRKVIHSALVRIPENCRVARSVKLALAEFDAGHDWKTARNKVVEESADLGWFQAPSNVAFTVIGLLYGNGDFGKSICTAVNCGDDTDCTGATCGAILGIMKGRSGIPLEWIEPIGENIKTIAVNPFGMFLPSTLDELTDRIIACKMQAEAENPALVRLTDGVSIIDPTLREMLMNGSETAARVLSRSSKRLDYALPYGRFSVEFEKGPLMSPGESQKLTLTFGNSPFDCRYLSVEWHLPDGWMLQPGPRQRMMIRNSKSFALEVELTAGDFSDVMIYPQLELRISDRNYPYYVTLPFQLSGSVVNEHPAETPAFWDNFDRSVARKVLVEGMR